MPYNSEWVSGDYGPIEIDTGLADLSLYTSLYASFYDADGTLIKTKDGSDGGDGIMDVQILAADVSGDNLLVAQSGDNEVWKVVAWVENATTKRRSQIPGRINVKQVGAD